MYEKISEWFKKYWSLVAGALLSIAGFFIGRRFPKRTDGDPEGLRQHITELGEQLASARRKLDELERINGKLEAESEQLRADIEQAERAVRLSQQYHADAGDDIEGLRAVRDRLAALAARYAESAGEDTDNK